MLEYTKYGHSSHSQVSAHYHITTQIKQYLTRTHDILQTGNCNGGHIKITNHYKNWWSRIKWCSRGFAKPFRMWYNLDKVFSNRNPSLSHRFVFNPVCWAESMDIRTISNSSWLHFCSAISLSSYYRDQWSAKKFNTVTKWAVVTTSSPIHTYISNVSSSWCNLMRFLSSIHTSK